MSEPWNTNERRAEIEAEIGVDPIELLQHKRREAMDAKRRAERALAPLEALFGNFGNWEERRKSFRSRIATEIAEAVELERAAAVQAAMKIADEKLRKQYLAEVRKAPSEAEVERLAAGHPSYIRFIKQAARMRRRYNDERGQVAELQQRVDELTEKINRDQAIIRYVTQTPHAVGGA